MYLAKTCVLLTLSPAPPVKPLNQQEAKLKNNVMAYVDSVIRYLPAKEDRLEELRCQQ